ncbi:unnamed protein product [Prunus armeniaca]
MGGKIGRAIVRVIEKLPLFTWVLFPIYREVKVGGLHKVSMWDFVQIAMVVTHVLEIRFGSLGASPVESFSRCLAPWKSVFLRQWRRRICLGASRFKDGYARLIMV